MSRTDIHFAIFRTFEEGQRYRMDFDVRLVDAGRNPGDLKILPGIRPIVAATRDEAKEKENFLQTLVPERIGVDLVSSWCGVDVSRYPNGSSTAANARRAQAAQTNTCSARSIYAPGFRLRAPGHGWHQSQTAIDRKSVV